MWEEAEAPAQRAVAAGGVAAGAGGGSSGGRFLRGRTKSEGALLAIR